VPFGIAAPVTDSVVVGYRIAITPDRLLGRVESARSNVSLLLAPLGPLAAGLLLEFVSTRLTYRRPRSCGARAGSLGDLQPRDP
jgi:hypothetical protein